MCEEDPEDAIFDNGDVYCTDCDIRILGQSDEHARQLWNAWVEGYKKGGARQELHICNNCQFCCDRECRRYPISINGKRRIVNAHYWCGEWEKREE